MSGPSIVGDRGARRLGLHLALVVGRDADDPVTAEAEVLQRGQQGRVRLLADDDGDLRRPVQAAGLDVPAFLRENGVARRRQPDGVAQPGARRQADARVPRQPEELEHPGSGRFLCRGGCGRECVDDGVLAPGRRQPVRGRRGRQLPADHEPEVAGADTCHHAGIGRGGELLDHGDRVHRSLGKLCRKPLADGRRIGARPHVAVREAGQVVDSDLRGTPQGTLSIIHGSHAKCCRSARRRRR